MTQGSVLPQEALSSHRVYLPARNMLQSKLFWCHPCFALERTAEMSAVAESPVECNLADILAFECAAFQVFLAELKSLAPYPLREWLLFIIENSVERTD